MFELGIKIRSGNKICPRCQVNKGYEMDIPHWWIYLVYWFVNYYYEISCLNLSRSMENCIPNRSLVHLLWYRQWKWVEIYMARLKVPKSFQSLGFILFLYFFVWNCSGCTDICNNWTKRGKHQCIFWVNNQNKIFLIFRPILFKLLLDMTKNAM